MVQKIQVLVDGLGPPVNHAHSGLPVPDLVSSVQIKAAGFCFLILEVSLLDLLFGNSEIRLGTLFFFFRLCLIRADIPTYSSIRNHTVTSVTMSATASSYSASAGGSVRPRFLIR